MLNVVTQVHCNLCKCDVLTGQDPDQVARAGIAASIAVLIVIVIVFVAVAIVYYR